MATRQGSIEAMVVMGLAVVLLAGCDLGGTYSQRYTESLASVGQRAALDQMLHAALTDVMDAESKPAGVKLRLPSTLDASSKSLPAADPSAQPPFVRIPGLHYALERLLDDPADATKFAAAYCYLGAVPKADQKADALQAEVQKQVAAAFAGATWQDVQLGTTPGKLLSVSGPQDFATADATGTRATTRLDGRLDLYFCESGTHFVFIGFRSPTAQATKYSFFEAVQAAVGTLTAG